MEVIITLALASLIVAVAFYLTELASKGLGQQLLSGAVYSKENIDDTEFSKLAYEIKFSNFIALTRFSKGGEIRIPDWNVLGDTEAERARNLLLIRDNNVKLIVEATGETIQPITVTAKREDLATKN
jgi:hypothetical protein